MYEANEKQTNAINIKPYKFLVMKGKYITDEDLEYVPGQESELFQRLTGKLGNSPDDVRRFIESIAHNEDMAG